MICDARFEDEIEYIRKRGGKIVRVYRPGTQQDGNHASEVYIDTVNPDFIIHNDSDLEHLGNQVKKMLGSFYG